MAKSRLNKSLQELEGKDWGEPIFDSYLVTECHRLRRVPLCEFNAENLRIMIGQDIGLPHLVPMALDLLRADPFTAGHFYEGDLLVAVLKVETAFWMEHPVLRKETATIAEQALNHLLISNDGDLKTAREGLIEAYEEFQRSEKIN